MLLETLCFLVRCSSWPLRQWNGLSLHWLECHAISSDPHWSGILWKVQSVVYKSVTNWSSLQRPEFNKTCFSLSSIRDGNHAFASWWDFSVGGALKTCDQPKAISYLALAYQPRGQVFRSDTQNSHSKGTYTRLGT